MMEVIKKEPEVDPLTIQSSDCTDTDEKKPISEERSLLDFQVAGIKTECVDHSCDLTSESEVKETAVPTQFVSIKCEAEEVSLGVSVVKEETMLEVTTMESEVLTESILYNNRIQPSEEIHTSPKNCVSLENSCSETSLESEMYDRLHRRKRYLQSQYRTYTDNWPFKCDVCGKWFTKSSTLTRHIRKHIGKTSFQ
ncbi:zinc finger protein 121-like isoform X2 [Periplaneta americana]|uniref:zinc finger protein 121-like isoform X2 n=1 Tax=Periplaneta americana TaxID=6978 RepID=UPI0037E75E83